MLSESHEETLASLVGSELTSVVFVMDYVQFVFQPATAGEPQPGVLLPPTTGVFATLTAFAMPTILVPGSRLTRGVPGHADRLVAQILRRVRRAVETPTELSIEFDSDAVIAIALDDPDHVEMAMLSIDQDPESRTVWN